MRIRSIAAMCFVLLPVGLSAQRLPRIRGRIPIRAEPLPPQPPAIARELAYKRMRISIESYPLVTYIHAPAGAGNIAPRHTSFGAGTRADYRITRFVSGTLDMTSSFLGGNGNTETAEVGLRLRPERTERRVYPFVDVRAGYVYAMDALVRPFDVVAQSPGQAPYGGRYSDGLGLVGGVGMEYALTRRFSLTTAGSVMRSRMKVYSAYGPGTADPRYSMTAYRFTLGIRYNPVRLIRPTDTQ